MMDSTGEFSVEYRTRFYESENKRKENMNAYF